jgi:hypothetical protein
MMTWIKENIEKLILILVALALLVSSILLVNRVLNFEKMFEGVRIEVSKSRRVEQVDTGALTEVFEKLKFPDVWTEFPEQSLFSAERYIEQGGRLIKADADDIHAPISNEWLEHYGLDILDTTLKEQDMDSDGFTVLEEFKSQTSPVDRNAHPDYWTKLRLKKFIRRKFRLIFSAYNGIPGKPESLTFQLNTLDLRQPTQFLKIDDRIAGTKFKIAGFKKKTKMQPSGLIKDVSELTVENTESGSKVVLVLERVTDSPDSFALFKYLWDGSEFPVQLSKTFTLKPDERTVFELIEITNTKANIMDIATGERHQVPVLE